jgi:hypothetical protein
MTLAASEGVAADPKRRHPARVDGLDGDVRWREAGIQPFDRGSALGERDAIAGGGEDRRPVVGEASRELAAHRLRLGDGVVDVLEQALGALEQRFSRQRQLDPVSRAAQQIAADQLLERADLAAQRRLREVKPIGTAGEAELFGYRDEGPQVAQLDRLGGAGEGEDVVALIHTPIMRVLPSWRYASVESLSCAIGLSRATATHPRWPACMRLA